MANPSSFWDLQVDEQAPKEKIWLSSETVRHMGLLNQTYSTASTLHRRWLYSKRLQSETIELLKGTSGQAQLPKDTMISRLIEEKATKPSKENMTDIFLQSEKRTKLCTEMAILLLVEIRICIRLLYETNKRAWVHPGTTDRGHWLLKYAWSLVKEIIYNLYLYSIRIKSKARKHWKARNQYFLNLNTLGIPG